MIPAARPQLDQEEITAVREVLESGQLVQGERVAEFERRFARYVNRRHAVAVSSGTAALHLALLSLGVGPGDEVILPPLTFFSSASMVAVCGATPRFADVERATYTLDPEEVERLVGKSSKAMMPVDMYGLPASMDRLLEVAEKSDLRVIEDACQAHGASFRGLPAGSFGDASCFSFYATKNMTTGEGGMIVTDSEEIEEATRLLRDQGQRAKYDHVRIGYNLRMTEVAAALGLVQLGKLNDFVAKRRRNAAILTKLLAEEEGLILPFEPLDRLHSFHQYIVRLGESSSVSRDEALQYMNGVGIGARSGYPRPLYEQEAFVGLTGDLCPRTEAILPQVLELPVYPSLLESEIEHIGESLKRATKGGKTHGT